MENMQTELHSHLDSRSRAGNITNAEDARKFITAGRATFSLVSQKTGVRFTFKCTKKKEPPTDGKFPVWVSVLTGTDNDDPNCYSFMGTLWVNGDMQFKLSPKSRISKDALSVRAIEYLVACLNKNTLGLMEFWHEGRCCKCGRKLTVPSSIHGSLYNGGFGPECVKYRE